MKKVKVEKEEKKSDNGIEHYSQFKNFPVVKFEAGFQMGKKKIAAVLANKEELQKFAAGEFDEEIKSLEEGEVLKP
jgi:hypothetical protein